MNIDSLKDTVSNLTLYDLKAGVRKVQNGEQGTRVHLGTKMENHDGIRD